MKKILVGGCSWSDPNYRSQFHPEYDTSFKKWFDYLDIYGSVKSVGRSGEGNEEIIKRVIDQIFSEPVDMIVIGLSNWLRFNVLGQPINPQIIFKYHQDVEQVDKVKMEAKRQNHWVDISKFPNKLLIHHTVDNNFLLLKILIELCENRGIDLYVFQMLSQCQIDKRIDKLFFNEYVSHDYFHDLWNLESPSVKLLGFPFDKSIGGYNLQESFKKSKLYTLMTISDQDAHPNELGHKFIGEWVIEKIENS